MTRYALPHVRDLFSVSEYQCGAVDLAVALATCGDSRCACECRVDVDIDDAIEARLEMWLHGPERRMQA